MEQGSYMLITRGMNVRGTDGDLGTVSEVVADEGADIFRGIVVGYGLLSIKHGFIPANLVVSVEQNNVHVRLSKTDVDTLPAPTAGGQEIQGRNI